MHGNVMVHEKKMLHVLKHLPIPCHIGRVGSYIHCVHVISKYHTCIGADSESLSYIQVVRGWLLRMVLPRKKGRMSYLRGCRY